MVADRFENLFICPRDFTASRRFYVDVLGWQIISEWTDNHGKKGVTLNGGAVRVVLAESPEDATIQNPNAPHAATLHLDIHDADKRFAQIPAGEHIVQSPHDNERGARSFVLRDPDGNLIAFDEMRQRS